MHQIQLPYDRLAPNQQVYRFQCRALHRPVVRHITNILFADDFADLPIPGCRQTPARPIRGSVGKADSNVARAVLVVLADVLSSEVLRVRPSSLEVSQCSSLTGVAALR